MKLLLTSGGITNDTLAKELESLAGKPFSKLKIAFVPTAAFESIGNKNWLIDDLYRLKERGAEVELVEIASLRKKDVLQRFELADVLFFGGGNTFYLSWAIERQGLFEDLPALLSDKVYAGISAGSMVATKSIRTASQVMNSDRQFDESYNEFGPVGRSHTKTFGFVDFAFRPHLHSAHFRGVTIEKMQIFANKTGLSLYTLDDESAVKVVDDVVTPVGEGQFIKLVPQI
ncbi:MAG: dipeptidase [Patescibacteria group bacterium]|nr:Type 1 glutamine amidotransferase-like domain-containing protein [Candidatus Saccharibacteria bacterium]MDQ5963768.1 dipeptidase [Patescibacteria group bacterium]